MGLPTNQTRPFAHSPPRVSPISDQQMFSHHHKTRRSSGHDTYSALPYPLTLQQQHLHLQHDKQQYAAPRVAPLAPGAGSTASMSVYSDEDGHFHLQLPQVRPALVEPGDGAPVFVASGDDMALGDAQPQPQQPARFSREDSGEFSEDVLMGAYFLSHLQPSCENCHIMDTPQWRKGWYSDLLGREVLLCNACGLKFHKSQFCVYCKYVYGKEQDKASRDEWLGCAQCGRWTHTACEQRATGWRPGEHDYYLCVDCRRPSRRPSHL